MAVEAGQFDLYGIISLHIGLPFVSHKRSTVYMMPAFDNSPFGSGSGLIGCCSSFDIQDKNEMVLPWLLLAAKAAIPFD